eukprot:m.3875 g.3875  ORF g.3875 m.3875 type:complete len:600 (-) comp2844_c0_seq1:3-1802(-)
MLVVVAAVVHLIATTRAPPNAQQIRKIVQPIVDEVSAFHNVSFAVGLHTEASGTVVLVSGYNDRAKHTAITADGRFPMGSVTKSWTAASIMRLWEQGKIDIDKPISTYVDDIMWRLNKTTVADLWNHDPRTVNMTARLLMAMRAGLQDYNDSAYVDWTIDHPNKDWTPFDMLHALNKTFVCDPGSCGQYASPGYELLGLALCQLNTSCKTWQDLNQMAVLPASLQPDFTGVAFPGEGKCSDDPKIVHQYQLNASDTLNPDGSLNVSFHDIINDSCLNGWACGNIAATVGNIAEWFWDLFHEKIVNSTTLSEMCNRVPLTNGWNPGLRYGLGMSEYHVAQDCGNHTWILGHGGADWGSIAEIAGYNLRYNLSINIATNGVAGMNCSADYRTQFPMRPGAIYSEEFYTHGSCIIYDAVLRAITGSEQPIINCTSPCKEHEITEDCARKLESLCGKVHNSTDNCKACVAANETALNHSGCIPLDYTHYCVYEQCQNQLEASCGAVQNGSACAECLVNHASDLALAGCSTSQEYEFCPWVESCYKALDAHCEAVRKNGTECRACTAANHSALAAAHCTVQQETEFCPKKEQAYTSNYTCTFQF